LTALIKAVTVLTISNIIYLRQNYVICCNHCKRGLISMFQLEDTTKTDSRKILALIALTGASFMAYNAGNYLSKAGVVYYTICALALLLNYRRAALLLWAAVGAHTVLVGYALWGWQAAQVVPCIYCFGAAGFALLAATVYVRLVAAVLPVLLITCFGYAWPYVFADNEQPGVNRQPGPEAQYQTSGQQPENQSPEVKPGADAIKGTTASTAQPVVGSIQTETQQEQTPAVTDPDSRQGNTPGTKVSGNVTPGGKPDSGMAEEPPEPASAGSG
jgi:hypothetical protein